MSGETRDPPCAACHHDHTSRDFAHLTDTVCPLYPASCQCVHYERPIQPPAPRKRMMCRRCGQEDNGGFHQAECLSGWVEMPAHEIARRAPLAGDHPGGKP